MPRPHPTPRLIAVGFCLGALGIAPAGADDALAECLQIESAVKRLACFEEIASTRRESGSAADTAAPRPPRVVVTPGGADGPADATSPVAVKRPSPASDVETERQRRNLLPSFRRAASEPGSAPGAAPEFRIESRIVSARRATRYAPWVLTLANGEVWRENEPDVQRIRADQDVVITKGALNYSMRLGTGRTILVRQLR